MFQVSPASLQTFIDKLNYVLKAHVQYDTVQAASVVYGTQVRGFAPGRSHRIFRAKISSALLHLWGGGEYSRRSHAVALRHVKDP
jgi:hypothetical protein